MEMQKIPISESNCLVLRLKNCKAKKLEVKNHFDDIHSSQFETYPVLTLYTFLSLDVHFPL